ncbi:MAG: hypothetical protein KIT13_08890 [Burkholderiales bacterium]|nr:hypothetical protein [Burkholderiales bacterium]
MRKIWICVFLVAGCAAPQGLFGGTVGEKFRKALANVDTRCKERKIGPYLDPTDPEYRRKSALTNCDVLKIKPFDLKTVLATPEGKFAYSIQLPPPLDKPRVRRSDYRSAEEYFEALCQHELVETTFKKVKDVDGIAVLRVYPTPYPITLGSYSDESNGTGMAIAPEERLILSPPSFQFVERPLRLDEQKKFPGVAYLRFEKDPDRPGRLSVRPIDHLSATYASIWRGTPSMDDRQDGIFGGELILLDRKSGEIVGIRRTFSRDEVNLDDRSRVRFWSLPCPNPKRIEYIQFLKNVLVPAQAKE